MARSPGKARAAQVAAARSRAAKWKRVRFKDNRLVMPSDAISGNGCWCGDDINHDWPGRDKGKPHPVDFGYKGIPRVPPHILKRRAVEALQEAGVCPVCRGYPAMEPKSPTDPELVPRCRLCLGTGDFPPPAPHAVRVSAQKITPKQTTKAVAAPEGNDSMTTQSVDGNKAPFDLNSAISGLPENWIACRDMRHAWKIETDFHVLADSSSTGAPLLISRVLVCMRCKTQRQERYLHGSSGLEKVRQAYNYPEGYMMHNVPRGVRPQSVIQQEQYRRAMERFASKARDEAQTGV